MKAQTNYWKNSVGYNAKPSAQHFMLSGKNAKKNKVYVAASCGCSGDCSCSGPCSGGCGDGSAD